MIYCQINHVKKTIFCEQKASILKKSLKYKWFIFKSITEIIESYLYRNEIMELLDLLDYIYKELMLYINKRLLNKDYICISRFFHALY